MMALPNSFLAHVNVRKTFSGNSKNPTIVLIEDVHQNEEVQEHISQAIKSFGEVRGENRVLVGLEGAHGRFIYDLYKSLPDREIASSVADSFFQTGDISGPAHAGFTSYRREGTRGLKFWGVDDPHDYRENVAAYRTSHTVKATVAAQLDRQRKNLQSKKARTFSSELNAFDAAVEKHRAGIISLGEYVKILHDDSLSPRNDPLPLREGVGGGVAVRFGSSPHPTLSREGRGSKEEGNLNLEIFIEAYAMEKSLDLVRVESERSLVLEKLVKKLSAAETQGLMDVGLAYQQNKVTFADYHRHLKQICRHHQIDLSQTPHFDNYIRYVLLSDGVNAEKLDADVNDLEAQVYERLAKTDEQKRLVAQSRRLYLTEGLIEFRLTSRQWKEYTAFAGETSPELKPFEQFYRLADARTEWMVKNLLTATDKSDVLLLVCGGFHTAGLIDTFRKKNISTIVATPKLTKADSRAASAYLSVFDREKSPLEQLFSGKKLFMAAPVNGGVVTITGEGAGMDPISKALATAAIAASTKRIPGKLSRLFQKLGLFVRVFSVSQQDKRRIVRARVNQTTTEINIGESELSSRPSFFRHRLKILKFNNHNVMTIATLLSASGVLSATVSFCQQWARTSGLASTAILIFTMGMSVFFVLRFLVTLQEKPLLACHQIMAGTGISGATGSGEPNGKKTDMRQPSILLVMPEHTRSMLERLKMGNAREKEAFCIIAAPWLDDHEVQRTLLGWLGDQSSDVAAMAANVLAPHVARDVSLQEKFIGMIGPRHRLDDQRMRALVGALPTDVPRVQTAMLTLLTDFSADESRFQYQTALIHALSSHLQNEPVKKTFVLLFENAKNRPIKREVRQVLLNVLGSHLQDRDIQNAFIDKMKQTPDVGQDQEFINIIQLLAPFARTMGFEADFVWIANAVGTHPASVRVAALQALPLFPGETDVIRHLHTLSAEDPEISVRHAAQDALVRVTEENKDKWTLIHILNNPAQDDLWGDAIKELGSKRDDPDIQAAFLAVLTRHDNSPLDVNVRIAVVRELARHRSNEMFDAPLRSIIANKERIQSPLARQAAMSALASRSDDPINLGVLRSVIHGENRDTDVVLRLNAVDALGSRAESKAVRTVLIEIGLENEILLDENHSLGERISFYLAPFAANDGDVKTFLMTLLKDNRFIPNGAMRREAVKGLSSFAGEDDVQPKLIAMIKNGDESAEVRCEAIQRLVPWVSDDRVQEALLYVIDSDEERSPWGVRQAAVLALASIAGEKSVKAFLIRLISGKKIETEPHVLQAIIDVLAPFVADVDVRTALGSLVYPALHLNQENIQRALIIALSPVAYDSDVQQNIQPLMVYSINSIRLQAQFFFRLAGYGSNISWAAVWSDAQRFAAPTAQHFEWLAFLHSVSHRAFSEWLSIERVQRRLDVFQETGQTDFPRPQERTIHVQERPGVVWFGRSLLVPDQEGEGATIYKVGKPDESWDDFYHEAELWNAVNADVGPADVFRGKFEGAPFQNAPLGARPA